MKSETFVQIAKVGVIWFQSTHSMKSETGKDSWLLALGRFQSTHSMKSETADKVAQDLALAISIHSLNEEWDRI